MSLMDELYAGTFRPMEHLTQTQECLDANRAVSDLMEQMRAAMGKEEFALVERLVNQIAAAQVLENRENYKRGLADGIMLVREAREIHDSGSSSETK